MCEYVRVSLRVCVCVSVCVWYLVCHSKGRRNRPRVFDNRVLRKTFGSKRDDVTGEWRKLCDDKLGDFC